MGATVLGNRYEILRKVGDGGMAFVYEARDQLLNRRVAVKVLRPEYVDDEEFLEKFKREAKAVASLSHPNIVNVYDVGEDGKVNYIIMEYVDGKNLKEIIQSEGTLDEYTALDITKQIAMALSSAHRNGIIHRDIKPHNILISNEGRVVKVADFGIAKAVSSSTMTNIGSVIGSVHYFSPEQAKGKHISANADLYSLGIVLYEMIVGRVPFVGESPISIALKHINDEIEFTPEQEVKIPQSIRTLISKMTEKSPDERYQTAEELIEDIEYIEKNIDLDFIKEYDDFATRKIDERDINNFNRNRRGIAPIPMPLNEEDEDFDEEYYDDDDEYYDDDEYIESPRERRLRKKKEKELARKNKKKDTPQARKKLKIIAGVLILILIAQVFFLFKILGFNVFGAFGSKNMVDVPNVVEMSFDDAKTTLEKDGLVIKLKSREYSSTIPEDEIISQDPKDGKLKKGSSVEVVVSRGKENVQVPNVKGLPLTQAKKVLEENELELGDIKYEYSTEPEGTVISQSVVGGSGVAGEKVSLVVSKGREERETPRMNQPDLEEEIRNNRNNENEGSDSEIKRPNTNTPNAPNNNTNPGGETNTNPGGTGNGSGTTITPGGQTGGHGSTGGNTTEITPRR